MTPENMRDLAGDVDNYAADMRLVSAYLRAAADQLDYLRAYVEDNWAHGKFTERGKYLPLVDAGPLLEMLTGGEQR